MSTVRLQPIKSRRKVEAAQNALRSLALKLGAHNKLPTSREICRELSISAVTLEHVLAGLEEQCVIVRRQGSGIYVSPQLFQKSVGLVFGRDAFRPGASPFYSMAVEYSQRRAAANNERLSFFLDVHDPAVDTGVKTYVHKDLIKALEKRQLDGLLLTARDSAEQERWLREQGLPVVSFMSSITPPTDPGTVGFDYQDMCRKWVGGLVAHGCQNIAMISSAHVSTQDACTELYRSVLAEFGLEYHPDWILHPLSNIDPRARFTNLGFESMNRLMDLLQIKQRTGSAPLNGVIVMDDILASGAIAAVQKRRLIPGADILMATHANRSSVVLQPYQDQLITLEVDPVDIIDTMFSILSGMMDQTNTVPSPVLIRAHLQVGAAVAKE